jgi:hypothetical protein
MIEFTFKKQDQMKQDQMKQDQMKQDREVRLG